MKKPICVYLIISLLLCLSCTPSPESPQQPKKGILLYPDCDIYCVARCGITEPELAEFTFCLPIFTSGDAEVCREVSELRFFHENDELQFDSISHLRLYPEPYSTKYVSANKRQYSILADLSLSNVQWPIQIDKVSVNIEDVLYEFVVDIELDYLYIQPNYRLLGQGQLTSSISVLDCVESQYPICTTKLTEGGIIISCHSAMTDLMGIESVTLVREETGDKYDGFTTPLLNMEYYDLCVRVKADTDTVLPLATDNLYFTMQTDFDQIDYCTDYNGMSFSEDYIYNRLWQFKMPTDVTE